MNLQDSQIETLAEAAKIEIKDIDKNRFKKDLDGLISSLEILRELDAENIEPMINVHDYKNVFRDDIVENENYQANQEVALKNAPKKKDGFVLVPKIME